MSIELLFDKATSPDLQDDDYATLLDIVELVNKNPSSNVTTAIRLLKVKLQSSNANTLLRSITLLDFLAENCGALMKAAIATPDFINDYLLSIIEDSLIHISIKVALTNEIYKLSKSFQSDPSLSIMTSTFNDLKIRHPDLTSQIVDQSTATIASPPNNEEDLLIKKAIEESLKDSQPQHQLQRPPQQLPVQQFQPQYTQQQQPQQQQQQQPQQQQQQQPPQLQQQYTQQQQQQQQQFNQPQQQFPPQQQAQQPQLQPQFTQHSSPLQPQQTMASINSQQQPQLDEDANRPDKVVALFDLSSDDEDTLSFNKNDIITIVEEINQDWLRGCLHGRAGIVPTNYVKKIPKTTHTDLANLIKLLNESFDIESTLSQLMDLSKKINTHTITNAEFQSILVSKNFPSKIQKVEQQKQLLKQILELQNLKILELKTMQSNVENSLNTYQSLISTSNDSMDPTTEQDSSISQFIQTYPDISKLDLN
ncbi:hypothetical protein CANINC_002235 [Pichia inconspicua]|uniref:Class E vacuolar protein-sorting machinery protein HSE1 n=1 Tax=Pichia inconspicua TaxID=52247 RepID=A0A4T0X278_9ASCO|nr:hypothetical protein CANINC_002235 [[Candida] inconspicua]